MLNKEKILKDFEPLIKASIKKYFINNSSFEDAFQDGILKMLELLESFDSTGKISLECYLKYQMKFFYMQKYTKQKNLLKNLSVYTVKNENDKQINEIYNVADENENVEEKIFECERNKAIKNIILTLPEKQRKVVYYKFFNNLKNKEIAKKMYIKEDTVKEYYKIAKKKLKKLFKENEIYIEY